MRSRNSSLGSRSRLALSLALSLVLTLFILYQVHIHQARAVQWLQHTFTRGPRVEYLDESDDEAVRQALGDDALALNDDADSANATDTPSTYIWKEPTQYPVEYREVFSRTTKDRSFFSVFMDGKPATNPNIIPHPTKHDWYIVTAVNVDDNIRESQTWLCEAGFFNGVLVCSETPTLLPVTKSIRGRCQGSLEWINFRQGSRDARMFYSPHAPYVVFGSQSQYGCLGLWLQDARRLVDAFHIQAGIGSKLFHSATELQRPVRGDPIQKNFFLFWDNKGRALVHHDIWPNRTFAMLDYDGSVGEDLSLETHTHDAFCMAKYMPYIKGDKETIHQATNSLAITLCARANPNCKPNDNNTFIMHIFQHKLQYNYHFVYEPYVVLFRQRAPYELYAISQRPLWIRGRGELTRATGAKQYANKPDSAIPKGHTEMFYMTSLSWSTHGQKYHGYMDDPLFLSFGIEDTRAGGIDLLAGDLLQDLAFC